MNYYIGFFLIIAAYLIGSIPTSVWVGKLFYHLDVRDHGSGNAGATNTIRVLGYKAGIPVLLFDVFKGWLAVQLIDFFPHDLFTADIRTYIKIALSIAAVVGHIFPVYAGFRGGKGVGTLAGVGIALYPIAFLVVLGIFIVCLILTRYVSLSSILASVSFPFIVIFMIHVTNPGLIILSVLVALFVPVTHRKNIQRLLKGTETRFQFTRKKTE